MKRYGGAANRGGIGRFVKLDATILAIDDDVDVDDIEDECVAVDVL